MSEVIEKFDERGNITYLKDSNGFEYWSEYNENDNMIHWKSSNGAEHWWRYDEESKAIEVTKQKLKEREEIEFLKREPISRFEIMDI